MIESGRVALPPSFFLLHLPSTLQTDITQKPSPSVSQAFTGSHLHKSHHYQALPGTTRHYQTPPLLDTFSPLYPRPAHLVPLCLHPPDKQAPTMSSYSPTQFYSGTLPMPVPGKGQQRPSYYHSSESTYSVSPPEADVSVSSSGGAGGRSYSSHSGYSATTSYAGSSHSGDYESERSASGVDFNEYMHEHLASSFDPLGLDKAVATQAQT